MGSWIGPLSFIAMLFVLVSIYVFKSDNEAKTYNRMCNPEVKATLTDALFAELRVDGNCAKH